MAGLAVLALGTILPDAGAQRLVSSRAPFPPAVNAPSTTYPVYFSFKLLESGKEAKVEGKTEAEFRADLRNWLEKYASNPAKDSLGLDAVAAYLAKIGNDPRYQPKGTKGWIRHEWINQEFETYNVRWAPVVYALDNRKDLDSTYRTQLMAYLAGEILEQQPAPGGMPVDTGRLVPLINELPVSCKYQTAPRLAVKEVGVGYGLAASDNLDAYVQELYPSTATDRDKLAKYGQILATLNPHAIHRTIGAHYVLQPGMTVAVPAEAFLEHES